MRYISVGCQPPTFPTSLHLLILSDAMPHPNCDHLRVGVKMIMLSTDGNDGFLHHICPVHLLCCDCGTILLDQDLLCSECSVGGMWVWALPFDSISISSSAVPIYLHPWFPILDNCWHQFHTIICCSSLFICLLCNLNYLSCCGLTPSQVVEQGCEDYIFLHINQSSCLQHSHSCTPAWSKE